MIKVSEGERKNKNYEQGSHWEQTWLEEEAEVLKCRGGYWVQEVEKRRTNKMEMRRTYATSRVHEKNIREEGGRSPGKHFC